MPLLRLDKIADIYTRTGAAGFTTLEKSGLICGLRHLVGGQSGPDRSSLAERRHLQWGDVSYEMPYPAQVEIDGVRWSPLRETFRTIPSPRGAAQGRAVDVVRVLQ